MKKQYTITTFILIVSLFAQVNTEAQSVLDKYLSVMNYYTQQPAHVQINVNNSANVVYANTDTAGYQAELFSRGNDRLVKMGNAEQIISNGISLFVQHDARRMVQRSVQAGEQAALPGLTVSDDKQKEILSKTYQATDENNIIQLSNKLKLPGTDISTDVIRMQYDPLQQRPVSITLTRRSLVLYQETDSIAVEANGQQQLTLVQVEGMGNCFVREISTTVSFLLLEGGQAFVMPFRLSDRIEQTETGFKPAKGFEDYILWSY